MRILKYTANQFDTDTAPALCAALEASLGLRLCVTDPLLPNDVHGFVNTSSDGGVEVHLYEPADCDAIEAKPEVVRFVNCPECNFEHNDWTDPDVCEDCGHDLDYSQGRPQRLKSHSGIYKSSTKSDATVRAAVETVLVTGRDMKRHEDNANGMPVRQQTHEIDAHARSVTRLERKAGALLKRQELALNRAGGG